MMKVLMFGWEFPPFNSGGLGVACLGLTRALASQNTDITFVLPFKIEVSADFLKFVFANKHVKVKTVDSALSPYMTTTSYLQQNTIYKSGLYGSTLFDEVTRYAELAGKIAKEEDFDIIHAHDWLAFGAGIEAKTVSGKPLVVHVHATEFDRSGDKLDARVYEAEKAGLEAADGVVAVSQYTKDILVSRYGVNPHKITVAWNGIDPSEYSDQSAENKSLTAFKKLGYKVVLFVGRITMQKGPDYFLQAAKEVLRHNPKVLFVVAGAGDMQYQIMQQTAFLGISDKVIFPGFLRGAQLNSLYRSADLFVLSSVSEPFGITTLESMINGTPVLVSRQSGVAEGLSHALKVDFWDTPEMAAKILAVLEHNSLQQTLSQNGQQEVQKFSWQSAAEKCRHLYTQLLLPPGAFA